MADIRFLLPNGAAILFPEGTPQAEIERVVREAVQGQRAFEGRPTTQTPAFDVTTPDPMAVTPGPPKRDFGAEGLNIVDRANRGLQSVAEGMGVIGRGAMSGLAFGADDEIGGFLAGMFPGGQTVPEAIASQRESKQRIAASHPELFTLGNVAGGLATIPVLPAIAPLRAANLAGRVGNAAIEAGAYGAATGVGTADGRNLLEQGAAGLIAGAPLGPLAPLATSAVRAASGLVPSMLRRTPAQTGEATRRVAIALQRDHPTAGTGARTLGDAADQVGTARAGGVPLVMADTGGGAVRDLLHRSTQVSSEARDLALQTLEPRAAGQVDRMAGSVGRVLGAVGDVEGQALALRQAARTAQRPLYDAVWASPGADNVWTRELQVLTNRDSVRRAVRNAESLAREEGVILRNPFRPNEEGMLNLVGGRIGDFPGIQFWHYVQQDLNRQIEAARRNDPGLVRLLTQTRRDLMDELYASGDAGTAYRNATGTARRYFGEQDAFEAGANFMRAAPPPDTLRRTLAAMTAPERQLYELGAASVVTNRVRETPLTSNATRQRWYDSPADRERAEVVFGAARAAEVENIFRLEDMMTATRGAVGTPQHASLMAGLARYGAYAAGGAVGGLALGGGNFANPLTYIPLLLLMGARKGMAVLDEQVAAAAGRLLMSGTREGIEQAAALLGRTPGGNLAVRNADQAIARILGTQGIGVLDRAYQTNDPVEAGGAAAAGAFPSLGGGL